VVEPRRRHAPGSVSPSPEAEAAIAAFIAVGDDVGAWLASTATGRELVARGWADDVATAAVLDADTVVPVLDGPSFAALAPDATGRHVP